MENIWVRKLFSTGPGLVVAVDHGLFDGPVKGIERVSSISEILWPGVDAVLGSMGMYKYLRDRVFSHRTSPTPIVRINWSSIYCFTWDYHTGETVPAVTPREALSAGVPMVLISLSLCTGSEARDTQNIKLFAELCREAHDLGMGVVGEYFPVNDEKLTEAKLHEEVKIGCRILFELGADVIKTFQTQKFDQVVDGCPIPILTLGGKRGASDAAAVKMAEEQVKSGSAGVVFGRNIFQANDPVNLQKAILEVLKDKMPAQEAIGKYGLK